MFVMVLWVCAGVIEEARLDIALSLQDKGLVRVVSKAYKKPLRLAA